jgi:ribonuclease HI
MTSPADDVIALEWELLKPSTRGDAARLNELLHPEFVEVGASGRLWNRAEMIQELVTDPEVGELDINDVVAGVVSDDAVLITYTSRRATSSTRRASRNRDRRSRTESCWCQGQT